MSTIDNLVRKYWNQHTEMLEQGYKPLEVAAVLMVQALTIYKTVLNADEYEKIVDGMSDRRDEIKPLPQIEKINLQ